MRNVLVEVGFLFDANLGLLHVSPANDDRDQATAPFQALVDRFEPARRAME
ncbi:hypothetical protein [Streptomyces erythrochromogenes]|uniref:hypothetical protein n=1 Tax=Streptomyces erythrochromogenes TaxID=285574 RepID=UPI0037FD54AB